MVLQTLINKDFEDGVHKSYTLFFTIFFKNQTINISFFDYLIAILLTKDTKYIGFFEHEKKPYSIKNTAFN